MDSFLNIKGLSRILQKCTSLALKGRCHGTFAPSINPSRPSDPHVELLYLKRIQCRFRREIQTKPKLKARGNPTEEL